MKPKGIRDIESSNETNPVSSVNDLYHHDHDRSVNRSADLEVQADGHDSKTSIPSSPITIIPTSTVNNDHADPVSLLRAFHHELERLEVQADGHDSKTSIPSSPITIIPTSTVNNDHADPVSLLRAFHHELERPNETMDNNQRDEFLRLIEADEDYRTLTAVSIIDPSTMADLESIKVSKGIIRNPIILNRIENGGNDFQRVLDGTELLLRLLTETTNGNGVFRFEDHPSASALIGYLYWFGGNDFQRVLDGTELLLRLLTETTNGNGVFRFEDHPSASALIGYLYWFVGATGPAVAFSSMSEFSRNCIIQSESSEQGSPIEKTHSEIINGDLVDASPRSHGKANHEDLLPRFTVMLVRNLATPSHKNSIEANLNPLDGGSFLE